MTIRAVIACIPPSTTAQMKRVRIVGGKPVFFHSKQMQQETATWAALLRPFVPAAPIEGPVRLVVVGIWPHMKDTKKADQPRLLPKTSKPDASNYAKHLEDLLVKMRFLADDSRVASITVEKWRGPAAQVGIRLFVEPLTASATPALETEAIR